MLPLGNPAAGQRRGVRRLQRPWLHGPDRARGPARPRTAELVQHDRARHLAGARGALAGNPVNSEGWALYPEAEMVPHEPIDGQLIALQFRLMRAARACSTRAQPGRRSSACAGSLSDEDVVLSRAMANQELDRYQFRSPGAGGELFLRLHRIMRTAAGNRTCPGRAFRSARLQQLPARPGPLPPELLHRGGPRGIRAEASGCEVILRGGRRGIAARRQRVGARTRRPTSRSSLNSDSRKAPSPHVTCPAGASPRASSSAICRLTKSPRRRQRPMSNSSPLRRATNARHSLSTQTA